MSFRQKEYNEALDEKINAMNKLFPHSSIALIACIASMAVQGFFQSAIAQSSLEEKKSPYSNHTSHVLIRALNGERRDTDESFNTLQVLNDFFGIMPFGSGYPEQQSKRDIKKISALTEDLYRIQGSSDPVIRTRDLPSQFSSSLYSQAQLSPF